jgi:hypothetical protein
MAQRNVPRRLRIYVWLSVLLFAGLGVSLLYSSWQEHERILHGKTVVAVACDFRRGSKNEYLLRYHFQLGPTTYSCGGDGTGRTNMAASVRRETWDRARKTGTVSVLYDVRNPWNNEAADESRPPWEGAAAAVGLLVFACLLWWMMKNKVTSRGPKGSGT